MLFRRSRSRLRPLSRVAALALALGLVSVWVAGAAQAVDGPAGRQPPFRLKSPRAGETWVAGTWATLRWEAAGDAAARAGLEEWEAFLSVDDGETYAVRITPHLDIDLDHFTFEVPRLPTRQARLLLRFGDERQEYGFEIPWSFSIADGHGNRAASSPFGEIAFLRPRPGERARKKDPGTVLWIEGSRRGGDLRTAVAIPLRNSVSGTGLRAWHLFYFLASPSAQRAALPRLAASAEELPPLALAALSDDRAASAKPPSIRLLIHRFNE